MGREAMEAKASPPPYAAQVRPVLVSKERAGALRVETRVLGSSSDSVNNSGILSKTPSLGLSFPFSKKRPLDWMVNVVDFLSGQIVCPPAEGKQEGRM